MRCLALLILSSILVFSNGCMVMDEIDSAAAKMPATKKTSKAEEQSEASDPATAAFEAKNALLEQSKEWWDKATSLSPNTVSPGIVRCRLASGTQFMERAVCLSRGGRPENVSG